MKKLLLIASFLLSFAGLGLAQTTPAAKKDKAAKTVFARPATATPAATAAAPTKKDGTPDMRYKANKDGKTATPATTHVKKDGTPDKRFKENKDAKKKS